MDARIGGTQALGVTNRHGDMPTRLGLKQATSCGRRTTERARMTKTSAAQRALARFSASGIDASGSKRNGSRRANVSGWLSSGRQSKFETRATVRILLSETQWLSVIRNSIRPPAPINQGKDLVKNKEVGVPATSNFIKTQAQFRTNWVTNYKN